jgi:hypothetical protein
VFVDPIGWYAYSLNSNYANTHQRWLCGVPGNTPNNSGTMRRASFRLLADPTYNANLNGALGQRQELLRWMTFLDDIYFPREVTTLGQPGTPVDRMARYSWAYICRRSKVDEPASAEQPPTVVVFSGRPLFELTGGQPEGETQYDATFDTTDNSIMLTWAAGQTPPELREGRWILDPNSNVVGGRLITRGYFYRVVSVEASGPNAMIVQVQPPLRYHGGNLTPPAPKVIVMDNVVEVFEHSN